MPTQYTEKEEPPTQKAAYHERYPLLLTTKEQVFHRKKYFREVAIKFFNLCKKKMNKKNPKTIILRM